MTAAAPRARQVPLDAASVAIEGAVGPRSRLPVLDGWRGISILLVLATHMLPVGPKAWQLNLMTGPMGMSLFFTLSGFLIVSLLLRDDHVGYFLVRRALRVVPLAWLYLAFLLGLTGADAMHWLTNFGFIANLPPFYLVDHASHFWSLGVEMQFYAGVALVVAVLGRRGLALLPVIALAITGFRISQGETVSIVTWFRVDEILAGATLALVYNDRLPVLATVLARIPLLPTAILFCLACHPATGALGYARPYLGAALVGITLFQRHRILDPLLACAPLRYVATISYALYVIHPATMIGWLGSGEGWTKYAKRPLSFALTFGLAHLSTFHYERRFQDLARRLSRRQDMTGHGQ